MIIAIHQPNYAPWLGYFHKIHRADIFLLLDDAQFTKNSYINRVQILDQGRPVWLTVPAKPSLGTEIRDVVPAQTDWSTRHLSRLSNTYRKADHFRAVWPAIEEILASVPTDSLCESNCAIIQAVSDRLALSSRIERSSNHPNTASLRADARLIDLIQQLGVDDPVYVSGSGGRNYQSEEAFKTAGIELTYSQFKPCPYPQLSGAGGFVPGLGVFDALFNLGWDGARDLVTGASI